MVAAMETFPVTFHVWERGIGPDGPVLICRRCETVWHPDETERQQGSCPYTNDLDEWEL